MALKVYRRLNSIHKDILACVKEGRRARLFREVDAEGQHRIELHFERIAGRRVSHLKAAELELLAQLPGVRDALDGDL
jgi:hypothetical protein